MGVSLCDNHRFSKMGVLQSFSQGTDDHPVEDEEQRYWYSVTEGEPEDSITFDEIRESRRLAVEVAGAFLAIPVVTEFKNSRQSNKEGKGIINQKDSDVVFGSD